MSAPATPAPEQVTCRHCPATHPITAATIDQLAQLLARVDLLTGGMPYIDGWLITTDWTAYCPAHVDRIHTVHPVPTSQPCPNWCEIGLSHPYDLALAGADADSRTHERTVGDPDGLHVVISAVETVRVDLDGVQVQLQEPTIEPVDADGLTADQAEQLAQLLTEAAAQLRAAQKPARQRALTSWYQCAPVGHDGHRWPCPAAEHRGATCTDQGCAQ